MGKKEEITDLISEKGMDKLKKGQLLKFDYEGSITAIVITRIDRKNKRIWGEHTELGDQGAVMSHYRHAVDSTPETMAKYNGVAYCTDCEVPVSEYSTEDGDVKALNRADRTLEDGTIIE